MHADAVRVACAHNNLSLAKAVASAAPDEDLLLAGVGAEGRSKPHTSQTHTQMRTYCLWE